MPATITRGKTFSANEQVTNTKLHQLVDSATIAGIDQTNMASGFGVIQRSTSSPSNTDALWVDTNCSPPVCKIYDGTEWVATGAYGVFTNKSGGTRSAGDVVIVDTSNAGSYTTTTTAGNTRVLGVVMQSTSNNADGVVALVGARVTNLSVNATTAVGDYLATSTTGGQAAPSSSPGAGTFAIALASRTGAGSIAEAVLVGVSMAGSGPAFWVDKNGTNQTGIVTATATKITWSRENTDTDSCFASDRFTPNKAGKYLLKAQVRALSPADQTGMIIFIYKNGAGLFYKETEASGTNSPGVDIDAIVEANGTTDYFEIFYRQNSGGNRDVDGDAAQTFFQGCYLRS